MASGGSRGEQGSTAKFIHLLGKEARLSIIRVLASGRSQREVAEMLGVTPAAVTKYLNRRTHPSDAVLLRAIRVADREELSLIKEIMRDELLDGLAALIDWAIENGLFTREDIRRIEEVIYSKILLLAARGRRGPRLP